MITGELSLEAGREEIIRENDRKYETTLFKRDPRISSLIQFQRSMDQLATLIGCMPPFNEMKENHPDAFMRVMKSSFCSAQFRLVGDSSDFEASIEILERLPLPLFGRAKRSELLKHLNK